MSPPPSRRSTPTDEPSAPGSGLEAGSDVAGRYRILCRLGAGGMGAVHLAEDRWRGGRRVALKSAPLADPAAREALAQEFRRLCRLRHPNVAAVHDFGRCEATRRAWFTMEQAEGRPFLEALRDAPARRRAEALAQLARALDFVHSRGLVHCDLKSENVVVQETGEGACRAVLVDFGLAAGAEELAGRAGGRFSGTLSHAAPELVGGEGAPGPATDLYALGVLLFELHAGRPPFEERDPVALAEAHRESAPPDPAAACPGLPPPARAALAGLLEKQPSRRPASAFAAALPFLEGFEGLEPEVPDSLVAHARAPRLVGADEALAAARQLASLAADRAAAGPRVLLFRGPAGTGKSRLLEEAAQSAQLLGLRVLRSGGGRISDPHAGLVAPIVEAVRAAGPAADHLLPELVKIAPELGPDVAPSPPLAPDDERLRLGAAAWEALSLAAVRPLLIALDGLESLPPEAAELAAYLVRRLELEREQGRRPAVAVVACASAEAAGPAVAALEAAGPQVRTRAWGRDDLLELLGLLFPRLAGAEALAARLHDELGGHPALTERWLESLVREGALKRGPSGWAFDEDHPALRRPPRGLEEALASSLAALDPELAELLVDAMLLPPGTPVGVLSALAERDPARQERGLDELVLRELLAAPSRRQGRVLAGSPSLVRAAAARAWPDRVAERASLLLEAARAEDALAPGDLAGLAEQARRPAEAARHWRAALQAALAREDHLRAGAAAERLAALTQGAERAGALRAQARAALQAGSLETAERLALHEQALVADGPEAVRERLELLRDVALARGRLGEAEERARELVESFGEPGPERRQALLRLGQIRSRDARREWSGVDPELAEAAREGEEAADVAMLQGTAMLVRGRNEEAVASFREALAHLPVEAPRAAPVHNNLGVAQLRLGRLGEAARELRRATAIRRRAGARLAMSGTLVNVALLELERARPAAAVKSLREALQVKREAGDGPGALLALTNLVVAELQRDEYARTLESLEQARVAAAGIDEERAVRVLQVLEAETCSRLGDEERLEPCLELLQRVVDEPSFAAHRATVRLLEAGRSIRRGETREAEDVLRTLHAEEGPTDADRGECAAVLADLLVAGEAARRAPLEPPAVRPEAAREALELVAGARAALEGEEEGWTGIRLNLALASAAAHDALFETEEAQAELAAARRDERRVPGRLQRAELHAALGLAAARRGDWATAEEAYAEALTRVRTVHRSVPPALREIFLRDPRRAGLRDALLAVRERRRKEQESAGFFSPLRSTPRPERDGAPARRELGELRGELRRLHEVIEITRDINALVPVGPLLERILDRVLSLMQAERGFIVLAGEGGELEFAAARDSAGRSLAQAEFAVSRSVLDEVVRTGRPVLSSDARADSRFVSKQSVLLLDLRSVLVAPLIAREEVLGALYVDNSQRAGAFGERERELLALFAAQAAVAVENARLHETRIAKEVLDQELRLARGIQQRLLPERLPAPVGWRVAASMRPARELGGDYYDGLTMTGGRARLAIGDVSGKGVPAGLVMVMAHAILREFGSAEEPLDRILARANAALEARIEDDKFMTLALLELEPGGRSLRLALAGHEPPLVRRRASGEVEALEAGGIALGMLPDAEGLLREDRLDLEPGDLVCCYTDGVTECLAPDGAMFGRERLVAALAAGAGGGADGVVEEIERRLAEFRGEAERSDDVTLLVLEAGEAKGERR